MNKTDPVKILVNKMDTWFETSVNMLPNIIIAILVVLIFVYIQRVLSNIARKKLKTDNEAVRRLLVTLFQFIIVSVGIFFALGILNLDKALTSVLAGAGVAGLAIGFAFQEIITNFICGIIITIKKPYVEGDIIKLDDYIGTVKEITLRTSNIVTFDGLDVLIPNKEMFTKAVTNYTTTSIRRVEIKVGVSYSENLRKVEEVVKNCLADLPDRTDQPIDFFYQNFGDSSINFSVFIWINFPANGSYPRTTHQAIIKIKEAFDREGINIPFPIRTLDYSMAKP